MKKVKEPRVAIITSTFNQEKLLEISLNSVLKKTNYKNYKIFVIDDSGKGEIGKKIKKNFKKVDVTINRENKGFSKSNNIGIKKAIKFFNPDYFLLLNDDIEIVDKDWLKKMVLEGEKDPKTGILGCKFVYPDGSLQWFWKNEKINFNKINLIEKDSKETEVTKEVGDIMGACFLIKKEVISKIGFLDEKFSPAYGEETDFCYRASRKGFKLVYFGKTKIIHYGSASSKTMESDFVWFIKKRNAIRLEWLNHKFKKILKFTIIHFGSAIISKNPLKKLKVLAKAYMENLNNLNEIKEKRRKRR